MTEPPLSHSERSNSRPQDQRHAETARSIMYDRDGGFARADVPRAQVYAILAVHSVLVRIAEALEDTRS